MFPHPSGLCCICKKKSLGPKATSPSPGSAPEQDQDPPDPPRELSAPNSAALVSDTPPSTPCFTGGVGAQLLDCGKGDARGGGPRPQLPFWRTGCSGLLAVPMESGSGGSFGAGAGDRAGEGGLSDSGA